MELGFKLREAHFFSSSSLLHFSSSSYFFLSLLHSCLKNIGGLHVFYGSRGLEHPQQPPGSALRLYPQIISFARFFWNDFIRYKRWTSQTNSIQPAACRLLHCSRLIICGSLLFQIQTFDQEESKTHTPRPWAYSSLADANSGADRCRVPIFFSNNYLNHGTQSPITIFRLGIIFLFRNIFFIAGTIKKMF